MIRKFFVVSFLFFLSQRGVPQVLDKTVKLTTGINMFYREAGVAGKRAILFIHGYTDSGRSFYPTIDSFLRITPNIHVFAPDLRGHGRSSMPMGATCSGEPSSCFQITDFANDIVAFMDELKIKKAHFVGHSLGAAISQELALSNPDRVLSLTLIGAFVELKDNPMLNDFLLKEVIEGRWKNELSKKDGFQWPRDAYFLTPLDVNVGEEEWLAMHWAADPTANPDFVRSMAADAAHVPIGTWLGALSGSRRFDSSGRLEGLKVRTLVLWARQDMLLQDDPHQAKLRAALETAAKVHQLEYYFKIYGKEPLPPSGFQEGDLGHNLHWGAPGAVARDLAAFIQFGSPTPDLYYSSPENPLKLLVEEGEASVTPDN